jgi:hypothetical protein
MQHIDSGLDVKPTISCTKAHIKMTELDLANSTGSIEVDGKIVTKSQILPAFPENDPGIEVNTYKAAIEPVWHLPGLAKRFDVSEELLRRALFEGMSFLLSFPLRYGRSDKRKGLMNRNRGNVPRTPYSTRPRNLPSTHRRSDGIYLWKPRILEGSNERTNSKGT